MPTFHPARLAVLYVLPQGWRYFESRASDLDELEAAFWAPARRSTISTSRLDGGLREPWVPAR